MTTQNTTANAAEAAEEIINLFEQHGNEDYDGEPVSQTSHMVQCAMQAIDEGADKELVLGAFLHDVGHLLKHQHETETMGSYGVVNHEAVGADFLRHYGFDDRVIATVDKHVDAKRYLVATDENYKKKLSPASQQTLIWQGGPMNAEEVKAFESNPYFKDIIKVRLWDEGAKRTDTELLPLSYFKEMIEEYLSSKN